MFPQFLNLSAIYNCGNSFGTKGAALNPLPCCCATTKHSAKLVLANFFKKVIEPDMEATSARSASTIGTRKKVTMFQ